MESLNLVLDGFIISFLAYRTEVMTGKRDGNKRILHDWISKLKTSHDLGQKVRPLDYIQQLVKNLFTLSTFQLITRN